MDHWIKDRFERFMKVNHTFWNIVLLVVKYALLSILLAAVYYGIVAAFVSTDTEKRLKKENELYKSLYPGMLERKAMVADVIDYLQIRDARIYKDVFYASAPSLDPVASTDFFSGLHGVRVVLAEHRALGLFLDLTGEILADKLERGLARTETRQTRLPDERLLDLLDAGLGFISVKRHYQLDLALVHLLRFGLH